MAREKKWNYLQNCYVRCIRARKLVHCSYYLVQVFSSELTYQTCGVGTLIVHTILVGINIIGKKVDERTCWDVKYQTEQKQLVFVRPSSSLSLYRLCSAHERSFMQRAARFKIPHAKNKQSRTSCSIVVRNHVPLQFNLHFFAKCAMYSSWFLN